jgi:hypothetical protein
VSGGKTIVHLPWIVGIIALLAVFIQLGNIFSPTAPRIDISQDTLRLRGASGDQLEFAVTGTSLLGHWASSTGLDVDIPGQRVVLAPPTEKTWTNSISYTQHSHHDLAFPGSIVVPSLNEVESRTITGTILGNLEFPDWTDEGFVNKVVELNISIVLEVVSKDSAKSLEQERRKPYVRNTIILLSLFVLAIPYMVFISRTEKRLRASRQ